MDDAFDATSKFGSSPHTKISFPQDPLHPLARMRVLVADSEFSMRVRSPRPLPILPAGQGRSSPRKLRIRSAFFPVEGVPPRSHSPQGGFLCGPYALQNILAQSQPGVRSSVLFNAKSTRRGVSLEQLQELAAQAGMHMQMAERSPGSDIIVGSVVHWKLNHYGALLEERNGKYLISDATFSQMYGQQLWISKAALEEESDGYFLVPDGSLSSGWRTVSADEGKIVWGKGATTGREYDSYCKSCDSSAGGDDSGNNFAMAGYQMTLLLVGLYITDTPIRYNPPIGPGVHFTVTYNQRDVFLEADPNYSNLGDQCSFNWFTYIADDGSGDVNPTVTRYLNSVGQIQYSLSNSTATTGVYFPDQFGNILQYDSTSNVYTLTSPDGAQQIFSCSVTTGSSRNMYLTQVTDPAGNPLTLYYDDFGRLSNVVDAINQTNTVFYDLPDNPYLITRVQDPFGRVAHFQYDEQWRLQKITDEIGITSAFTYDSGDFVTELTTPYGVTTFSYEDSSPTDTNATRWLYVTDPNGDHEYAYSPDTTTTDENAISSRDLVEMPANTGSSDFSTNYLDYRNTFYFDKTALSMGGTTNDFANATVYHWLHEQTSPTSTSESGILESIRPPLESRIYFWYPGQSESTYDSGITLRTPSVVARVVDDSTNSSIILTQTNLYGYNSLGKLTNYIDSLGRTTLLKYYPNGIDLQNVQQKDGSGYDMLTQYGTYNSQHRPATYTNSAGMGYGLEWNSFGQLTNVIDPNGDNYISMVDTNGYLRSFVRSGGGLSATNSYGYDSFGRRDATTNAEGYYVTANYDNLDRLTKLTHPDGTYESYIYNKLNLFAAYDRLGNRTVWTYDGTGRPLTMRDRLNRLTQYSWCGCGGLASVTDPNGHSISWSHDIEGRVIEKTYPDVTSLYYGYENRSSRLRSITDAESQAKYLFYNVDDTIEGISYSNSIISTPRVTFDYDTNYQRLTMMADGVTTNLYNYYPITGSASLGAGQLETVSNLFAKATIVYQYDALGRSTNRAIDTVSESVTFDGLGRLTGDSSVLGNFGYSYYPSTYQLATNTYPNELESDYNYNPPTSQDGRLATVETFNPTVSRSTEQTENELVDQENNYTYDVLGRVISRNTSMENVIYSDPHDDVLIDFSSSVNSDNGYDAEGQLLNSVQIVDLSDFGFGINTNAYGYAYDANGNRTSEQIETSGSSILAGESLYNNLNQLTNRVGTGFLPVDFMGTVNQPALVTLAANTNTITGTTWTPTTIQPAEVMSQTFTATLNIPPGYYGVPPGSSTSVPYVPPISVVAQSGTFFTTNTYNLSVTGATNIICKYDLDGNCTNVSTSGTNIIYTWDAENRLASINTYITNAAMLYTTVFSYDGFDRWCQIIELTNGVVESTQRFVWCGLRNCEERDGSDSVTKRFFQEGEQMGGGSYYYVRDKFGSIQQMVDADDIIVADYNYDPYGSQTELPANFDPTVNSDFGFDGYYNHEPSGLNLTLYRAYDPSSGRWLNRDPIGENGGLNLYDYVRNAPINLIDLSGLFGDDPYYLPPQENTQINNVPVENIIGNANGGFSVENNDSDEELGIMMAGGGGALAAGGIVVAGDIGAFGLTAGFLNSSIQSCVMWQLENPATAAAILGLGGLTASQLGYESPNPPDGPENDYDVGQQIIENFDDLYNGLNDWADQMGESEQSNSEQSSQTQTYYSGGNENVVQNATSP